MTGLLRKDDVFERVKIEPFLGSVEGNVRSVKADGHEEGFRVLFLEVFDGPVGGLEVGHLIIAFRKGSPVGLGAGVGQTVIGAVLEADVVGRFRPFRLRARAAFGAVDLEGILHFVAVRYLADAKCCVPVLSEVLGEKLTVEIDGIFGQAIAAGLVVEAGFVWVAAG